MPRHDGSGLEKTRSNMIPKAREQLRPRSDGEMSLGHDPDLIARYLAGEDVTEQLREMESEELDSDRHPRPDHHEEPPPLADVIVIEAKRAGSLQQPTSAPSAQKPSERPTLALIALAVALAMFAISIWIALR
jgi:hypothetical protein